MRNGKLLSVVAVVCAMEISAAAFAADFVAGPPVLVSGPSPLQEGCYSGPDIPGTQLFRNYEVEPMVAVDPNDPAHLVVAWQQDRWSWGGADGQVSAVSRDGGATWNASVIPGETTCTGGPLYRVGDDWLTFSPNGNLFHSAVTFDPLDYDRTRILISKSTDGGESWGTPATLTEDGFPVANDKPTITADPYDSRYVYATWVKTVIGDTSVKVPTYFTRSTDWGESWEASRMIVDPGDDGDTIGHRIFVLPNGELVNIFALNVSQIALVRSTDKGNSWGPVEIVAPANFGYLRDPATGQLYATGYRIPQAAVDEHTGELYVSWTDKRFDGVTPSVVLIKSTDGGHTWTAPERINPVPAAAFTPSVAVAKNGFVAVSYFDIRNNTLAPNHFMADHWILTSGDHGATWEEAHIAGPFDITYSPAPGVKHMLGDYVGFAAAGKSFVSAFVIPNYGDLANPTDIYVSVVTKEQKDSDDQ